MPIHIELDCDEQLHTILAALRVYQQAGLTHARLREPMIHNIATNGGTLGSLDDTGIDSLCESLNTAQEPDAIRLLRAVQDIIAHWSRNPFSAAAEELCNLEEKIKIALDGVEHARVNTTQPTTPVYDIESAQADTGLAADTLRELYSNCEDPVLSLLYEDLMESASELNVQVNRIAAALANREHLI